MFVRAFLFIIVCGASLSCAALPYLLPVDDSRVIGQDLTYRVKQGDYFQAIAEKFNVGMLALIEANPKQDPFLPKVGSELIIPHQMILPFGKREGVVINLPELRLYYFSPSSPIVHVFPVGIGKQGLTTPKVKSYIGEKRKDPIWRPTAEMRERYLAEHGKPLAKEVMPGPNNPFGKYALRIGTSEYLLHGSNQRLGIGMRSSSGCIRLYDDDIEWLFTHVPSGTPISIVEQPIKMSYELTGKVIEVHQPLSDSEPLTGERYKALLERFAHSESEQQLVQALVKKPSGLVKQLKK